MNTNGPARNPGGAIPVAHTPTISDATTLVLNDGQQGRVLLDALACLETADHYLRMLDGILIPASPDDPGPEPA